ncbi:FMN-binding pyridoxamine 5'-phosphate oxidase-related protein [Desulfamplus magnetovallimortis]|uniref:FMN-binding pyridoxamine 5'-phosphate oxidase-related protein n=1 Tax=Desulfamplus magnetovallimortis TaxID=1246637 RepID=A0A1W1H4K1_9BACT|nr:hypothetical protein [Desulfamplus magnetovallimortis]SLM27399.1 FMN-binding pyridoxamine 5'-phosphate oxidase-related protein [Desulfamplus magnetovallimortis]
MHAFGNETPSSMKNLLQSLKVMTIATMWNNGVWSAPLYYLYKNGCFYFFSSPASRHITGALGSSCKSSASIYQDDSSFSKIKGIQMGGYVKVVKSRAESLGVAFAYAVKYGFTKDRELNFLKETDVFVTSMDYLHYFQSSFRASLYKFVPVETIYMDNSVRIGFRQEITL